ncbi:hypothetical protein FQN57_002140 [Myotisia sp. PD_48]|nr:hypothetical protein FQN57_002140 [Myotisia sp. PD_48]
MTLSHDLDMDLVSCPILTQNTLNPSLLEASTVPNAHLAHNAWNPAIDQTALYNNTASSYGSQVPKQDPFYLHPNCAIPPDPDFDIFAHNFPMLDNITALEPPFEYQVPQRPNHGITARSAGQLYGGQYPNLASLSSKPSFESTIYPPPSPATSIGSSAPGDCQGVPNNSEMLSRSMPELNTTISEDETDEDSGASEEPYARLIWRALMSAPGKRMVLKEIYEWFEKNTNKAKNSDSKGWQNSIRHNLSMNAAFEGVKDTSSPDGVSRKSGNAWVLTSKAIAQGVQSTTRYRKPGVHKKTPKSEHPAPQRQRSGAKGGRAAKKAARYRRALQENERVERHVQNAANLEMDFGTDAFPAQAICPIDYEALVSAAVPEPSYTFGDQELGNLVGCTGPNPQSPLFYFDGDFDGNQLHDFMIMGGQTIGQDFNSPLIR